jgi:hypothetical protein
MLQCVGHCACNDRSAPGSWVLWWMRGAYTAAGAPNMPPGAFPRRRREMLSSAGRAGIVAAIAAGYTAAPGTVHTPLTS